METKAVCKIGSVYQYYVLTHYMLFTKYTRIRRLRYKLVDSKCDNKKLIIGT